MFAVAVLLEGGGGGPGGRLHDDASGAAWAPGLSGSALIGGEAAWSGGLVGARKSSGGRRGAGG